MQNRENREQEQKGPGTGRTGTRRESTEKAEVSRQTEPPATALNVQIDAVEMQWAHGQETVLPLLSSIY